MNKILIAFAFLMSSTLAHAGPCAGVTLPGEYQFLPLDGSSAVLGRIDLSFFGGLADVSTNSAIVRAAAKADDRQAGWNDIVVVESADPTRLGEDVGKVGRLRLEESLLACRVVVESKALGTATYRLRMKSPRGDLVLGDDHDKSVPQLILRKLDPQN